MGDVQKSAAAVTSKNVIRLEFMTPLLGFPWILAIAIQPEQQTLMRRIDTAEDSFRSSRRSPCRIVCEPPRYREARGMLARRIPRQINLCAPWSPPVSHSRQRGRSTAHAVARLAEHDIGSAGARLCNRNGDSCIRQSLANDHYARAPPRAALDAWRRASRRNKARFQRELSIRNNASSRGQRKG
jgi:hypothetical protein